MNNDKKYTVLDPQKNVLSFFEIGAILILAGAKSYYFYLFIGVSDNSFALALTTTGLMLTVFLLCLLFKRGDPITPALIIYFIMSALMFIDRLYASYFNGAMPKIVKLSLLGQLLGVTNSVGALFDLSHILYIIDVIPLLLYMILLRKKIARLFIHTYKHLFRYAVCSLCILLSVAIFLSVFSIHVNGGYYASLRNELFLYHTTDLISTLFPNKSVSGADPYSYLGKTNLESPYKGIAEGRNLINIQIEALNEYPIGLIYEGQELTPNLNKILGADTLYFDNYYWCMISSGGTSDAEFMVNNSLYPPRDKSAYLHYSDNDYYGLPYILKNNGFTGAYVFHGYGNKDFWNRSTAYPGQGFDDFINGADDFKNTETIGLGISDGEFFSQSMDYLVSYEQPFYAFLVTLTSHHPYEMPPEYHMLDLKDEHENTIFGNYLQSIRYVDEAIGDFLEQLKENDLYYNSVITLYGDHYGLNHRYDGGFTSDIIGEEYTNEEIFKIPLFIHIPGSDISETVSTTGSHIDYTPTVLSLFGIKNNRSVMFGQNLLAEDTVGKVFGQNHMSIGGFITDGLYGENTATGLKVYDKVTNEELDPQPYMYLSEEAKKTLEKANYLLDTNQIRLENFQ